MAVIRSREDIDELKQAWLADGCWDIEETEGFEAHFDELKAYREEMDRKYQEASRERLVMKAAELGVPNNLALAAHVLHLEGWIQGLQARLDRLEGC